MHFDIWKTEPNGTLSAQQSDIKLMVVKIVGAARYLVLREVQGSADTPYLLLAIGDKATTREAMKAAVEAASGLQQPAPEADLDDTPISAAAE